MKNNLKIGDFDFKYTGSNYTEKEAIENGFKQLTGEALLKRIVNKTFYGDYPMGYKFITNIYENNMDSFRNHLVSINDEYIIPIGTTNESEITVLHERFEKIMLDVIDHMNFDNIIETINNKYQQNQSTIEDETQQLRNMM